MRDFRIHLRRLDILKTKIFNGWAKLYWKGGGLKRRALGELIHRREEKGDNWIRNWYGLNELRRRSRGSYVSCQAILRQLSVDMWPFKTCKSFLIKDHLQRNISRYEESPKAIIYFYQFAATLPQHSCKWTRKCLNSVLWLALRCKNPAAARVAVQNAAECNSWNCEIQEQMSWLQF